MKPHFMLPTLMFGLFVGTPASHAAAEEYLLDPTHTYPNFSIGHLGYSVMHGRFNDSSGRVVLDREGDRSLVEVTVRATSVDTGMDKRDEHLRGPDYLDAAKYPEMTYKSSKVTYTSDRTATVEGNLTLHGVTRPLTLNVTAINCAVHPMKRTWNCGFDASASLKRSDFGVSSYVPLISDEMQLRLEAEGERKEAKSGR
jgi:polyisoprenoid-binding protein YceI